MTNPKWQPIREMSAAERLYHVRPDDVPLHNGISDTSTFGTAEVEEVAGHLIAFFKSHGYWRAFTIEELSRYYRENHWDPHTMFYGLLGAYIHIGSMSLQIYVRDEPLLVVDPRGKYCVTDLFIERCCRHMKKVAP